MRATVGLLLVLSAIAACSNEHDEQTEAPPMKVEDTAFGNMTQTMERAKSVETTLQQEKEDRDRELDKDGG